MIQIATVPKIATAILLSLTLSACDNDVHDHPELVSGRDLFEYHCASCHQSSGIGKFLLGIPPNKNTKLSFTDVIHKIKDDDGNERNMPLFETMSKEEASKITAYLKGLK